MDQPASAMTRRSVSSEGLSLAVFDYVSTGPTMVFVHGFPDDHTVWQAVIDRLRDRFRCVAYDVRGAGDSPPPQQQKGYGIAHLVTDLVAVLDEVSPGEAVHLVAHDWGSIQAWEAVLTAQDDPRLRGRIASYTSVSGPALRHVAAFYSAACRSGWRVRAQALQQLVRSWYVVAFQLPVLPELLLRATIPRDRTTDAVHGLGLYRANLTTTSPSARGIRTDLPVQLVVPLRDRFVTPAMTSHVGRFVPDLRRVEIEAGHWVMRTHPDELAEHLAAFALSHDTSGHQPAAPG